MLLKVTVNGQVFHVDAPNKATAKSFGKKQLKVEVEELSLADLSNLDISTVVKVEPEEKKAEGADAAAGNAETGAAVGDATNY